MKTEVTFYAGQDRLDYLALCIDVARPVAVRDSLFDGYVERKNQNVFEKAKEVVFRNFGFTPANLLFDTARKTVYEKVSGESVSLEHKRILLLLKGSAFRSRLVFPSLIKTVRELKEENIAVFLNRLDARRHFKATGACVPFKDLVENRGQFWITRSSKGAVFIPEMLSKSESESNGTYFRSNAFTIAVYDKIKHISFLENKLESLEDHRKIEALQQTIDHFREVHSEDECVYRFEIRASTKAKLQKMSHFLSTLNEEDEDKFMQYFFNEFYRSHKLKSGRKESETFKQFFRFESTGIVS